MRMSVDVFIPTLNSSRTVGATLRSLVDAGVPVNHVVVVDGYSTDCTLELVKRFCEEMGWVFISVLDDGGLGEARYIGNCLVETDIYVSVDSDVKLRRGWYASLSRDLEEDSGLVYSGSYLIFGDSGSVTRRCWEYYCLIRNTTPIISAALFRRSLADFTAMRGIHIGEDTIYNFHLLQHNGRYKLHHDHYALHPSSALRDLQHSYGWGAGAKAIGRNWVVEVIRIGRAGTLGIRAALHFRNPWVAFYMPTREVVHLLGYLRAKRIRRLHSIREEFDYIFHNRRIVYMGRMW
jgi:glycosyltransferase involved in cell wall biosynthesis